LSFDCEPDVKHPTISKSGSLVTLSLFFAKTKLQRTVADSEQQTSGKASRSLHYSHERLKQLIEEKTIIPNS
jgi:hypothetical protein